MTDTWTCSCGLTRPMTGSYGCPDCNDPRPVAARETPPANEYAGITNYPTPGDDATPPASGADLAGLLMSEVPLMPLGANEDEWERWYATYAARLHAAGVRVPGEAGLREAALAVYHGRIGFTNPKDPDILALGAILFPERADLAGLQQAIARLAVGDPEYPLWVVLDMVDAAGVRVPGEAGLREALGVLLDNATSDDCTPGFYDALRATLDESPSETAACVEVCRMEGHPGHNPPSTPNQQKDRP